MEFLALLFSLLFFGFFGFIFVLGILSTVLWIWMLIDCAQRDFKDKTVWILIIILTGIIGAVLYYFLVKRKAK